jgi:hypothetical protein
MSAIDTALNKWGLSEALEVCRIVEAICPKYGCHVGLTGGLLYKEGERKDLDLVLYRIRQCPEIEFDDLLAALEVAGFSEFRVFGFVTKCIFRGKPVDIFQPEVYEGEYDHDEGGAQP